MIAIIIFINLVEFVLLGIMGYFLGKHNRILQWRQKRDMDEMIRISEELDMYGGDYFEESEWENPLDYVAEYREDESGSLKFDEVMHHIDRQEVVNKELLKNPHRELEIEIEDMYDDKWEH